MKNSDLAIAGGLGLFVLMMGSVLAITHVPPPPEVQVPHEITQGPPREEVLAALDQLEAELAPQTEQQQVDAALKQLLALQASVKAGQDLAETSTDLVDAFERKRAVYEATKTAGDERLERKLSQTDRASAPLSDEVQ